MKQIAIHALLSCVACICAGSTAAPDRAKVQSDVLAVRGHDRRINVIIRFRGAPSAKLQAALRQQGCVLRRDLRVIGSAAYTIPAAALDKLTALPQIEWISLDGEVKATMDITAATTGASTAWNNYGLTGKGIGVAVIDTGVAAHADLNDANGKSRIVFSQFFRQETTADDLAGHGTHVAGIIAGRGTNSTGSYYKRTFKGIAPDAKIISLAALDRYSRGNDSDIIAAIQKAIDLKSTYNIRVMNLSLGRPISQSYKTDPLCLAVEKAWKAGIVVVVAAGNEGRNNSAKTNGYSTITAPGNDPFVITVGAAKTQGTSSRSDDAIASYSSKGPSLLDRVVKPDLVAPGNQVQALLAGGGRMRNQYPGNSTPLPYYTQASTVQGSDQYYGLSGTSMAAPVVSGAVALMLQRDATLTPDQVKARLMKTAWRGFAPTSTGTDPATGVTYYSTHDIFTIGAGYVDIVAALNNTDKAAGSAASPIVKFNSTTHEATLFYTATGTNVIWGSNTVWGTNVIWGTNVVSGTNVVWGTNTVWGTGGTSGFNVIWGSNCVWGTSTTPTAESDTVALAGER